MGRYAFDIETNGLLPELKVMHCIVAQELDTNEVLIGNVNNPSKMEEIVRLLEDADEIVAHNGYGFDVPALDKLYGFKPKGKVVDTLVLGRLCWPNIRDIDFGAIKKKKYEMPARLIGSHSLEAYGYRLRENKGDYGKQDNAWDKWTQDMEDYCVQDVVVLSKLYNYLMGKGLSPKSIELESKFAWIISRQERHGFYFNIEAALALQKKLTDRMDELMDEFQRVFPPQYEAVQNGKIFTPKKNQRKRFNGKMMTGMTAGSPYTKVALVTFNPNSRVHIAKRLQKLYGWVPTQLTGTGIPVINESVLNEMDFPEAALLSEHLMLSKRLGMLADGNQAWIKSLKDDGRIHGNVNTNGAVSGRCTHSTPNVAQVPAVYSPYGEDSRSLFTVPNGKKLVGCDASGLELRGLAHYLAGFDKGEYAKQILEGDIHTHNQKSAGLETRNQAKTFIYAFIYGAGDGKIGSIVGGGAPAGKKLKESFYKQVPALKKLQGIIANRMHHPEKKMRVLKGLDGRTYTPRSEHSALNLLIQGAGAIIMKQALINCDEMLQSEGWVPGQHYEFVANIHDEYQIEVDEDKAERCAEIAVEAIRKAGRDLNFKCPLDGEAKIGDNWKDTH